MKAGDRYSGSQGEIEIETDPFETRSSVHGFSVIRQVRAKFVTGQREDELVQWAVSYVEANFIKEEQ